MSAVFVCIGAFFSTVLTPVALSAQGATKPRPARSVEVKKVFGFYDLYLRLPPQDRDGFEMTFTIKPKDGAPMPQMNYLLGNTRTPVQIAPNGKVLNLPDMAMYRDGKVEIGAGQPSMSIGLELEPIIPLSRSMSVADVSNPITDYAAAIRRAGPLALAAPKISAIVFKGGSGGQAVFSDGRRVALPTENGGLRFQPTAPAMRGAQSISFATPPNIAEFAK